MIGLTLSGAENVLVIDQFHEPAAITAVNDIQVDIVGDNNGAGAGWPSGTLLDTGLIPGRLFQSGAGNGIALSVRGQDNVFAVMQAGYSNSVTGHITGTGNAAAITQAGSGNHVSFVQNGQNNMIMVSQSSQ